MAETGPGASLGGSARLGPRPLHVELSVCAGSTSLVCNRLLRFRSQIKPSSSASSSASSSCPFLLRVILFPPPPLPSSSSFQEAGLAGHDDTRPTRVDSSRAPMALGGQERPKEARDTPGGGGGARSLIQSELPHHVRIDPELGHAPGCRPQAEPGCL
eukprot:3828010-Rhodomonas_salina.2